MIENLSQPWPWWVAGPLIALVMFMLLSFGQTFGVSGNLRTICTIMGAGRFSEFFKVDLRTHSWNLVFVLGAVLGGWIAAEYLTGSEVMDLNPETVANLKGLGIYSAGSQYLPSEIFSIDNLWDIGGWLYLLLGGFLVGFGARYAGGCTSGHAITGLSTLQLPSLIAVIGFFIGGLISAWFLIPLIF